MHIYILYSKTICLDRPMPTPTDVFLCLAVMNMAMATAVMNIAVGGSYEGAIKLRHPDFRGSPGCIAINLWYAKVVWIQLHFTWL